MHVTQQDLKVIMATLRENGTEAKLNVENIGKCQDQTCLSHIINIHFKTIIMWFII